MARAAVEAPRAGRRLTFMSLLSISLFLQLQCLLPSPPLPWIGVRAIMLPIRAYWHTEGSPIGTHPLLHLLLRSV